MRQLLISEEVNTFPSVEDRGYNDNEAKDETPTSLRKQTTMLIFTLLIGCSLEITMNKDSEKRNFGVTSVVASAARKISGDKRAVRGLPL